MSIIWGLAMCGSKGSTPVTNSEAAEMAQYRQIAQQQPADWYGYTKDLTALVRGVQDNQYKGEMGPIPEKVVPQVIARELTKEELRRRSRASSTSLRLLPPLWSRFSTTGAGGR
jgi:hypothetical protein